MQQSMGRGAVREQDVVRGVEFDGFVEDTRADLKSLLAKCVLPSALNTSAAALAAFASISLMSS
eukprot:CAMPEP_0119500604 /NCGR_PEP_ID=MMETSP1344-20130328/22694_1 /TAXON_ID=236787 /ORGANISM="Florenciella parvula, Strain CCMP2471" /LENGTH=63 /DNA_ID=CAMNT_0007536703 /DNA_START=56 /DNA_END=245 /DNA_ORIENTATION=+